METIFEVKVRTLLESVLQLKERRFYGGDYDAIDELVDLEQAIELAELTDRQTEVLHLLYVEGLTQSETANLLGLSSQSTVSEHCYAAIRKIADIYKDWGVLF